MVRARKLLDLALLLGALVGCARLQAQAAPPAVQVVTIVVTGTALPTPTAMIVTEVQTVVVTATATPTTTPAIATTPHGAPATPAPPDSGAVASREPLAYGPIELLAPLDGATVGGAAPTLRWAGPPLRDDEYYEVIIERLWQGEPYYAGSEWTREPQFTVPTFVQGSSDSGHFTWWVTVRRLSATNSAGGKVGEALSPPSEQRTFTWSLP